MERWGSGLRCKQAPWYCTGAEDEKTAAPQDEEQVTERRE